MKQLRMMITVLLALFASQVIALESITPPDAPIVVYKVDSSFDEVKEFMELAITGKGMKISSTLHISDMQERTAKDTGLDEKLYGKAESLEFCSIAMSYKMSQAHPANLAICPLTIGIYTLPDDPDTTYITYQRPYMLGDGAQAEAELIEMYDSIIRASVE